MKKFLYIILIGAIFSSCAISRKVPYNEMILNLPQVKTENLSIAVWDQREQLLKGSRKPDFVGYMRSGAGIAYPMGTLSGKAFADEIALNIASSYKNNGLNVSIINTSYKDNENSILNSFKNSSNNKLILMKCNQLHTDGYNIEALLYNIQVSIYNKNGALIAQKSFVGKKELGKGMKYKTYMPNGLKELIEEIFNDATIHNAINYDITNQNDFMQKENKHYKTTIENSNSSNIANNPDIIYKKDGTEIKSKVIEITDYSIKYKKYEQLDGPVRNIPIKDAFMIIYKNGKREVFKK